MILSINDFSSIEILVLSVILSIDDYPDFNASSFNAVFLDL